MHRFLIVAAISFISSFYFFDGFAMTLKCPAYSLAKQNIPGPPFKEGGIVFISKVKQLPESAQNWNKVVFNSETGGPATIRCFADDLEILNAIVHVKKDSCTYQGQPTKGKDITSTIPNAELKCQPE